MRLAKYKGITYFIAKIIMFSRTNRFCSICKEDLKGKPRIEIYTLGVGFILIPERIYCVPCFQDFFSVLGIRNRDDFFPVEDKRNGEEVRGQKLGSILTEDERLRVTKRIL